MENNHEIEAFASRGHEDDGGLLQLLGYPQLLQNEDIVRGGAEISSPAGIVSVLSVAPRETIHNQLDRALSLASRRNWFRLHRCRSVDAASQILREQAVPVVVCERDLGRASWMDLLHALAPLNRKPSLIVTSRLADEYLWAEALNLGAYDVLAQPFDPGEVTRVVVAAWRHWDSRPAVSLPGTTRAASV